MRAGVTEQLLLKVEIEVTGLLGPDIKGLSARLMAHPKGNFSVVLLLIAKLI